MRRSNYQVGHERSKKKRIAKWLVALIVLVLLAAAIIFVVRGMYTENLKAVSSSSETITIEIPMGSTTKEIADILKEKGLIRATWAFQWYVNNGAIRDKLQAGTYSLRPNQSVEQIVAQLTHGQVATKLVTILPGKRIDQIKEAFIDSGFQAEDVEKAFNPELYADSPVLADKPESATTLEGLLYPDSFQRDNSTTPEEIVHQSLEEMQKKLTPEVRAGFTKQGLTIYEGLTLASIVEMEVPDAEDRPTAAQVFLNRLAQDMPLETDVSDKYGAILDGRTRDQFDSANAFANFAVNYDSPYNTRLYRGLPPSPIATVEQTAIQAVVEPSGTSYLYFVAGNDCVTRFSNTLAEHEAFIRQYGVGCQ